MNLGGLEIERRFLVKYPDLLKLRSCGSSSTIVQTYLLTDDGTARVRKRCDKNGCVFTHTIKRRISNMTREEIEREISEDEYISLLAFADPERRPIEKERICLSKGDFVFEIDIFPFWNDRAIMEVELSHECQSFELPNEIQIIKEVTDNRKYTNSSLAVSVPMEAI